MYGLIDIHVNHHAEPGIWLVSALSHVATRPGDDSPEEFGDSEDFAGERGALDHAETWARQLIGRAAEQVTVFNNGNEHLCLPK